MKSKVLSLEQKHQMFQKLKTVAQYKALGCQARFDSIPQLVGLALLKEVAATEKTPCILLRARKRLAKLTKTKTPEVKEKSKKISKVEKPVKKQAEALSSMPDSLPKSVVKAKPMVKVKSKSPIKASSKKAAPPVVKPAEPVVEVPAAVDTEAKPEITE